MKLFKAIISPKSSFLTPLKGDTLFGQICWAINYKFGEKFLNNLLDSYDTAPFLVVSDAFASGFVPKPNLPLKFLLNDEKADEKKKEIRKKIWLSVENLINGEFDKAKTNAEVVQNSENSEKSENLANSQHPQIIVRNTINRLSFTTGESDEFAPFSLQEFTISERDIYFLLDEAKFSKDDLQKTLEFIGKMGYGKKSTIGKGRFEICEFIELSTLQSSAKSFMTLSPVVLNCDAVKNAKECYYEPFVRFGKHGGDLANSSPFKKPILLADTGAVVEYESEKELKFIGRAVRGISAHESTLHQGYAIVLQVRIKNEKAI
ncbi:hypothetical protein OFO01_05260 [Campylobacter sp. JMF_01 NE2]|uniref:type III-A CRISPR-associated RAMP protein Csm4 n=1 Tax=unclassified Campylobacter TaxID=2593542 RepID=UPI0022E9F091|nr:MULTISPECIES: RAMP superfamily CRISPR-associated protein [unclassified Campylobacter]MDA3052862.1 hypothetical protein [Campylobacter sp. JMF_03 NE3]MDA3067193.1 hypothetical protein [Campylobacter sp. JMF_01 NE2]